MVNVEKRKRPHQKNQAWTVTYENLTAGTTPISEETLEYRIGVLYGECRGSAGGLF